MANNPKAKENLVAIPKGTTLNPHGRPKKFVSTLKAHGYKLSEINDCIKVMLSMTQEQLRGIASNPLATVLEIMIASAMNASIKRGDLVSLETLLNRAFGKPTQYIEANVTPTTDEQARKLFDHLIGKFRGVEPARIARVVYEEYPQATVKLLGDGREKGERPPTKT